MNMLLLSSRMFFVRYQAIVLLFADCSSLTCSEPLTNTLPGSPCGWIWPMQVGLRLSVPLYTFFPLVSELAQEIAAGVSQSLSVLPTLLGKNISFICVTGLPPSPPMSPSNITIEDGPLMTGGHGRAIKPLGVDIRKQRKKKLSGSLIAIIVLSSSIVLVLCIGVIWFLLLKSRRHDKHQPLPTLKNSQPTGKSSGI